MSWKKNNGGKNYALERTRDEATSKIANFQRQIHTNFRNFKHFHKCIFIHNYPIMLPLFFKKAGKGGGGRILDQCEDLPPVWEKQGKQFGKFYTG